MTLVCKDNIRVCTDLITLLVEITLIVISLTGLYSLFRLLKTCVKKSDQIFGTLSLLFLKKTKRYYPYLTIHHFIIPIMKINQLN